MLQNQRRISGLLSALLLWGCLVAACLLAAGCAPAEKAAGQGAEHVLMDDDLVSYISVESTTYNYISDAGISNYLGELQTEDSEADFTFSGSYVELDGLVDADLESEINRQIYERYQALCRRTELPAYGGIKRIQDAAKVWDITVSPLQINSVGNLFSVVFQKCWSFQSEDNWYWVTDHDAVVFDLKTGHQLSLPELFRENVDYREALNDQIRARLPDVASEAAGSYEYNGSYVYDEGGIRQIGPFRGIREDQMFSVSCDGIHLYFDERDRAFDTSFGSCSEMLIYYEDIAGSADYPLRFAAEQALYENPISFGMVPNHHIESDEKVIGDGDFPQRFSINWPESLPVDKRDEMIAEDRKVMEARISQWRSQAVEDMEEDPYSYLSYNIDIAQYGTYYNVSHSVYGIQGDRVTDYVIQRVFEGERLREVKPKELFVKEFDLQGYLNALVERGLEENRQNSGREVTYSTREILDRTMAGIYTSGIQFIFPVNEDGECITYYESYDEMGYENLALFQ